MSVTCSPRATVRSFLCAMTRARKSLRAFAYASSVISESRAILGILVGQSIRHPEQRERMVQLRLLRLVGDRVEPFAQMVPGERTVGCVEVRARFGDLAIHGPADLERGSVEFLLHAPGSGVAGATLDRRHLR